MRFQSKLLWTFLSLGLAAVGLTLIEASRSASAALREATEERLNAVLQSRAHLIQQYFRDTGNHVLALASDESAITALEQFAEAWASIPQRPDDAEVLKRFYESTFGRLTEREPAMASNAMDWMPETPHARALQRVYIADNPYPHGARPLLIGGDAGAYSEVHARFHPTLERYRSAFGYYDIFLIDANGRLRYSVMKEIDLGVELQQPVYRDTGLARAWRRAMALPEPESYVIEDYSPYLPSGLAPAAFVATPIYRAGIKIGVLAIQLPISEVNRVMTGGRQWEAEGLGATGEAYIVAKDGTLRSDLRGEIERPEQFLRQLREAGVSAEVLDRIQRYKTAVLNLSLPESMDRRMLRSTAPLALPDLQWQIVARISEDEALGPIGALQRNLLWQTAAIALVLSAAAILLARRVTRPVLALARSARRLGAGDFSVRTPVSSDDELGELATAFNRMTEDLEKTTISRDELDRMLTSLINAVFVIEAPRDAAAEAILEAPIRQANPAALKLLGRDELGLVRLGDLLTGDTETWAARIERLRTEGRLPATEARIAAHDGESCPVLFAASWLADEPGRTSGIVFAAQDIAEWKRTQAELERLTQRLISAQEEERARLARELHDDLTQRLAAVAIDAGRLQRLAPEAATLLERIKQQMAALSRDVHGLSRRLHPSALADLGLIAAIESECRAFFERGGAPVHFDYDPDVEELPPETQLGVYRIVQEALRNISRHADADEVSIELRKNGDGVLLRVADNGRGFDAAAAAHSGLGLSSMEERSRILGGRLQVESAPGRGTVIVVHAPVRNGDGKA